LKKSGAPEETQKMVIGMAGLVLVRVVDPLTAQQEVGIITGVRG
jgi:hypothetical protein